MELKDLDKKFIEYLKNRPKRDYTPPKQNPVFYNYYGIRGSQPTFEQVKKDFPELTKTKN